MLNRLESCPLLDRNSNHEREFGPKIKGLQGANDFRGFYEAWRECVGRLNFVGFDCLEGLSVDALHEGLIHGFEFFVFDCRVKVTYVF